MILYDASKIGARNQCMGLAQALGCDYTLHPVTVKKIWHYVPSCLWPRFAPLLLSHPFDLPHNAPDMIIASGRKSVVPAVILKKMYPHSFLILLQKPGWFKKAADAIILPAHDEVKEDEKTLSLLGNPHMVTPSRTHGQLAQFPELVQKTLGYTVISILVGGPNKAFRFSVPHFQEQWQSLLANLSQDPSLYYLVTLSRRTPSSLIEFMQQVNHPQIYVWNGQEDNPYLTFLALADGFVITADSVAMTSEAAATGKPIHLLPLPGSSSKFTRYHQALIDHGAVRFYEGRLETWSYPPLNETQRAAQWVWKKMKRIKLV